MSTSCDSINGVRSGVQDPNQINHVSLKLPQFFENSKIWFTQIDSAFTLANITREQTKFLHLITALPGNILSEFAEFLNEETTTPYSDLKNRIIKSKKMSTTYHLEKLLENQAMGDRKPSDILRIMKRHFKEAEPGVNPNCSNLLRMKFLRTLPLQVQHAIIQHKDKTLDQLAEIADEHMDIQFDA